MNAIFAAQHARQSSLKIWQVRAWNEANRMSPNQSCNHGRMSAKRRNLLLIVATLTSASVTATAAEQECLRLTHTVELPGVKGRFDHFSCDAVGRRLIV